LEDFPVTPLLLNVKQAAEMIGVGRSTLYELMDNDEVYSTHVGASRKVPLWAVYDYVDRLSGGQFRHTPLWPPLERPADEATAPDAAPGQNGNGTDGRRRLVHSDNGGAVTDPPKNPEDPQTAMPGRLRRLERRR